MKIIKEGAEEAKNIPQILVDINNKRIYGTQIQTGYIEDIKLEKETNSNKEKIKFSKYDFFPENFIILCYQGKYKSYDVRKFSQDGKLKDAELENLKATIKILKNLHNENEISYTEYKELCAIKELKQIIPTPKSLQEKEKLKKQEEENKRLAKVKQDAEIEIEKAKKEKLRIEEEIRKKENIARQIKLEMEEKDTDQLKILKRNIEEKKAAWKKWKPKENILYNQLNPDQIYEAAKNELYNYKQHIARKIDLAMRKEIFDNNCLKTLTKKNKEMRKWINLPHRLLSENFCKEFLLLLEEDKDVQSFIWSTSIKWARGDKTQLAEEIEMDGAIIERPEYTATHLLQNVFCRKQFAQLAIAVLLDDYNPNFVADFFKLLKKLTELGGDLNDKNYSVNFGPPDNESMSGSILDINLEHEKSYQGTKNKIADYYFKCFGDNNKINPIIEPLNNENLQDNSASASASLQLNNI